MDRALDDRIHATIRTRESVSAHSLQGDLDAPKSRALNLVRDSVVMNLTAASLAHEIRNPLAGIKGVADAFLQRGRLTRQEREWMTTKPEGTGLGLAAVRRTAAAYHGRITFKTRMGRGSTFILALPVKPPLNIAESHK